MTIQLQACQVNSQYKNLVGNIHVNSSVQVFSAQPWPAQPSQQAAHLLVRSAISSHRSNLRMMDTLATEVFSVVSSSIELSFRLTLSISLPFSDLYFTYQIFPLAVFSDYLICRKMLFISYSNAFLCVCPSFLLVKIWGHEESFGQGQAGLGL